jgi:hypothetical protein
MMLKISPTGALPVRYSVDGNYIACRSNNSGVDESVRILRMADGVARDVGAYGHIGGIFPSGIDEFAVVALSDDPSTGAPNDVVGVRVDARNAKAQEAWRLRRDGAITEHLGWSTTCNMGIGTDYRYVTRLSDLRTGSSSLVIDNSANYRPPTLNVRGVLTAKFVVGLMRPLFEVWGLASLTVMLLAYRGMIWLVRKRRGAQ